MSETPVDQRWRILFTPRWLSWHLFAVVAFVGMFWLGDWQFRRATAGNSLSWAYTFEWPVFAIFGAVFWVKTVRDELRPATPVAPKKIVLPAGAGAAQADGASPGVLTLSGPDGGTEDDEAPDLELAEYNAYLAKLSGEVKRHGKWHGLR
jgi:hypothetical protein